MYPQGVCRIRKPACAGNGCAIFPAFKTAQLGKKIRCSAEGDRIRVSPYLLFMMHNPNARSATPPQQQTNQLETQCPTISPSPKNRQQHPCRWFFRHIKTPPAYPMQGVLDS